MTIARIKFPGWGPNEKLTSGQQNALDLNVTNALDKRAGQTDTLSSVVTVASGGSITMASGSSFTTVSVCPAVFGGTFRANGTAQFFGVATFNVASTFNADITANSNITVVGDVGVAGTLTSSFQLTATGAATFTGATALAGATTAADLTMTATNKVKLASRSITRTVAVAFSAGTANWQYIDSIGSPSTSNTSSAFGWFHLALPEGAVLQTVTVYIEGAPGHGGAPASMPHIQLYKKVPSAGGTGTVVTASTFDTYVSAGTYESVHPITQTSIGYTVTRGGTRLSVLVQSENGANTVAGLIIHGCTVTYTTTSLDDGPCN
jgi:hypothetical protein